MSSILVNKFLSTKCVCKPTGLIRMNFKKPLTPRTFQQPKIGAISDYNLVRIHLMHPLMTLLQSARTKTLLSSCRSFRQNSRAQVTLLEELLSRLQMKFYHISSFVLQARFQPLSRVWSTLPEKGVLGRSAGSFPEQRLVISGNLMLLPRCLRQGTL